MDNQPDLISLIKDASRVSSSKPIKPQSNGIKHILVADDNRANQLIAKTVLERDGYKVTIAENGEDALMAVKAQASLSRAFDIILMDILMPVMDGIKALRRIKDLSPQIETPPIFAITAYSSPADQHRYRMVGFDAVLTKPLKHGDVEQALEHLSSGLTRIALLDDVIITQLRMAADTATLIKIQSSYWKDVRANSLLIKAALPEALNATACGLTVLRKSIHTIKGASANVGLLRASSIARHLQNAPPSQIGGLLKALFDTLLISKAPLRLALQQADSNHSYAAAQQTCANARIG